MVKTISGHHYEVVIPNSVEKDLACLAKKDIENIIEKLELLASSAISLDIKKLAGFRNLYRLRYRDYRIIYEVKEDQLIIHVLAFGPRKDVYKKLRKLFKGR